MNHDLILKWLGLPAGAWPPDHYRLLGLEPGDHDAAVIEQRVHQRIDSMRCYQIRHPEHATEAMNRLAQALVCLTDPGEKRAYDAAVFGTSVALLDAPTEPALPGTVATRDSMAWLYDPPPLRRDGTPLPPNQEAQSDTKPTLAVPTIEMPPAPNLPASKPPSNGQLATTAADPIVEAAQSPRARRSLRTKRAMYRRIVLTRHLIEEWSRVGKYLGSPKRRLNRPSEATELIRLLDDIQDMLRSFPRLMGEAGQPGYLVIALSQLTVVPTFQTLAPSQREALSRDWKAGLRLLTAHRDFLRQEVRAMRRRALESRLARFLQSLPTERPVLLMLLFIVLLAVVALNVAIHRNY